MRYAADFRRAARNALDGRWGLCIAVTLVAVLLGGCYSSGLTLNFNENGLTFGFGSVDLFSFTAALPGPFGMRVENWGGLHPLWRALPFLSLALFVIGGAVELGHNRYYLSLLRGGRPEFNVLFSRFSILLKALGLRLFTALFVFLWSLLLVIPGIVAAYRYRLAFYLMAENPDMGIREAVDESKRRTYGHKGRWFCLHFSFVGWVLLCLLTFGIGLLWLTPYIAAADAAFCLDLMGESVQQEPAFGYTGPERL